MTNEEHTTDTLMKVYYALCQWEHDYSADADRTFVTAVDGLMIQLWQERPDLQDHMQQIDDRATDESLQAFYDRHKGGTDDGNG
jgi:hypothetical protein